MASETWLPYAVPLAIVVIVVILGLITQRERPQRIVGAKVILWEFDGFGVPPPAEVPGVVESFTDGAYRIKFERAVSFRDRSESYAVVRARHSGYPVSAARRRRILAVNGSMESGAEFISNLRRAK